MTEQEKIDAGWKCDGCGSQRTIEEIRANNPEALSCCPERKLISPLEELQNAVLHIQKRKTHNQNQGWDLGVPWYEEKLSHLVSLVRRQQAQK